VGVAYATREDVYLHGLPRGAVAQGARPIASVDVTGNTLEVGSHGLGQFTPIQFQVDGSGVVAAPLSTSAVFYALPVTDSDSLIRVAASFGGPALDLTDDGSGSWSLYVPGGPMIDRLLETFSRWLDGKCIAHETPFTAPYPVEATHIVAVRTASHAARVLGLGREGEHLYEAETILLRDIESLVRGMVIRDAAVTTASTNLARGGSPGNRGGRWGSGNDGNDGGCIP
jgi:hypothetical protein